jgi:predicted O-methyltransferase YrrM
MLGESAVLAPEKTRAFRGQRDSLRVRSGDEKHTRHMPQETWTAVDAYIADLFIGSDPVLEQALADSAAAGLPAIAVAPHEGRLLMLLARAIAARRILEIGTLGGYSTIWLARALPNDGRLITLEFDPKHAAVAQANIARAGLAGVVDVRVGRAIDTLPQIQAEGGAPFDLVFIDADKQGYVDYLEWSLELSRPGALIIADNVIRDGKVLDANSEDSLVQGVRHFNEVLAADSRVIATAFQSVGTKGYDGMAVALVKADR